MKTLLSILAFLGLHIIYIIPGQVCAQALQSGARISRVDIDRVRDSVVVSMDIVLDSMEVRSNRSIVLQPLLVATTGKQWLPAIEVMGRRHHLYYERNGELTYADNPLHVVKKDKDGGQTVAYRTALLYKPWMDQAKLTVNEDLCGCGQVQNMRQEPVAQADVAFRPHLAYVTPEAETQKERALQGTAYLDFPVNRTEIYPDYRRNPAELAKIHASIDTVRNDPDVRVTAFDLKGYASPEGTYALNTRLAKGRTKALQRYVTDRYALSDTLFHLDYEPENWEGLRDYVQQTGLQDKDEILALIGSTEEPDAKEARLRREHPQAYAQLLRECYPGLRRTNYVIHYVVRGFNVEEAKRVIRTRPQNLSLQEMFAVAQTYEPGSREFNQVFDVAVRLYPDEAVANLNAANALLEAGLVEQALPFLRKAGDSPEAQNARGVALILQGRYDEAQPLLLEAAEAGLEAAGENAKIL